MTAFPPTTMKRHMSPHVVACLILGCMTPLHAQDLTDNPHSEKSGQRPMKALRVPQTSTQAAHYEVPPVERVRGEVSEKPPVFVAQDAPSLKRKATVRRGGGSRDALDVLRRPAPERRMASATRGQSYEVAADSMQNGLALVASLYRELGKPEAATDCGTIALSVAHRVNEEGSRLLEFVEREVAANPNCACEIVKAAIHAADAAPQTVAAIAETAIFAAPESMRMISQCAIATSPESLAAIQSLLARLDPHAGESADSAKGAKTAKGGKLPSVEPPASAGNPLDRPIEPPLTPPIINPPFVSEVNP